MEIALTKFEYALGIAVLCAFGLFKLDNRLNELEYATKLKFKPAEMTEEVMLLNGFVFSESNPEDIIVKTEYIPQINVTPELMTKADLNVSNTTDNFKDSLVNIFKKHEGKVLTRNGLHKAYRDSRKFLTIGYGCCVDCGCLKGTGVVLDKNQTIDEKTAMYLLHYHINLSIREVRKTYYWFDKQPNNVKLVLIDMAYNMGIGNLKKFKFTDFIAKSDYKGAADSLEKGGRKYISQVGGRALTNIKLLRQTKLS